MSALPPMTGDGLLPPGVHRTAVDQLRERFVDDAPFPKERSRVFGAFEVYTELVWALFPTARLWVNGGFVTHKTWAAPGDIDVAVLAPTADINARYAESLSLWTLGGVSVQTLNLQGVPRIQPMGGLIDGFCVPDDVPPAVAYWNDLWSRVIDENKAQVPGKMKGFVEVMCP